MKLVKKLLTAVIALVMMLGMSTQVFAVTQTVAKNPADPDNATITINNPAKGETYNLYKLFDATVGEKGEISYQCEGEIPSQLAAFFTKDEQNNVIPADSILEKDNEGKVIGSKMTDELKTALEAWAESQTDADRIAFAESNGEEALEFTGLPYGYYVVTTTHKPDGENAKAAITVTSTKPNASIYDKNPNEPTAKKEVEKESYSIGDTIKYTATFDTTNYMGEGKDSQQVVDYIIEDTLPPYLSDVTVTSITIDGNAVDIQQFDENKQIIIPWATKDEIVTPAKYTSLYNQGAQIVITYTAKLTSTTKISAEDKNTISITPEVDDDNGGKKPWEESWSDDEVIKTYATAIKKVDEDGQPLAGAKFKIKGLQATVGEDGVYTVTAYDPANITLENSTELEVDENGMLYIVGLKEDLKLLLTETEAPAGYNKLTDPVEVTSQEQTKEIFKLTGYRKYDSDGNIIEESESVITDGVEVTKNLSDLDATAIPIENNKGTELPSTGGMGTTIFYTLGGMLVLCAGVLLVSRRRMTE